MTNAIFYVLVFAVLWIFLMFIFVLNALCPKPESKKNTNIVVSIIAAELLRIMLLAGIFGVLSLFSLAIETVTIHANNYWWIIGMGFGEGAWVVSEYCATTKLMNGDAERANVHVLLAHVDTCITVLSWVSFLLVP